MHIDIVGRREFSNLGDADRFVEAMETAGFTYISALSNTPVVGVFTVRWGNERAQSAREIYMESMLELGRAFEEREQWAEATFTRACESAGLVEASAQYAAAAGYTGRDAVIYAAGFLRESAKRVNPRAEGREHLYRVGRAARNTLEAQRLVRVLGVKYRSILVKEAPEPIHLSGLIANGEC